VSMTLIFVTTQPWESRLAVTGVFADKTSQFKMSLK